MLSSFPLRIYLLSLLIIGSIFSLKAQDEQPIKRYKGFKLEFAALTRVSIYDENPLDIANSLELEESGIGDDIDDIGEDIGRLGWGIIHLAPQYYIHNNISVGLQYEFDRALYNTAHIFSVTGDYYFGNGKIRTSLGLGVGLNFHKQKNFDDLASDIEDSFVGIINRFLGGEDDDDDEEEEDTIEPESITALVLSPRFKLHLSSFIIHLGYDINVHEKIPNGLRLGIAYTLFGKKK